MISLSKDEKIAKYLQSLPLEKREVLLRLRILISENLPEGFEEQFSYNMLGYVVPHNLYPLGYHCNPKLPLPFVSLAAQKDYFSLYHMGIYADETLQAWFVENHIQVQGKKPNMGKSCIRFKKSTDIPYDLIAQLMTQWTPKYWVEVYQTKIKNRVKKVNPL